MKVEHEFGEDVILTESQLEDVKIIEEFLAKNPKVIFGSLTDVKLTGGRKNPHQGRVSRVTDKLLGEVNVNGLYAKLVNEQRQTEYEAKLLEGVEVEKPEEFVPSPPRWGKHIGNGVLYHNNQLYLSLILHPNPDSTSQLLLDGKSLESTGVEVEGLPKPSEFGSGPVIRQYNIKNLSYLDSVDGTGNYLKFDPNTGKVSVIER